MAYSFSQRVTTPQHVLIQELESESVLLNIDSGNYFGLDAIGRRFWDAITNAESIEIAYEQLLKEYEVDPQQLRKDLNELLLKLTENGLVELVDG